ALAQRPPAVPVLQAPADNAIVAVRAVNFRWLHPPAVNAGPVTYRLCLWDGGRLFNVNECTIVNRGGRKTEGRDGVFARSAAVAPRKVYFWKIVAEDANGNIAESA